VLAGSLKQLLTRKGLSSLSDGEVLLYAVARDQFDKPVAGAEIRASIQINNGARVGVERFTLAADSNGQFRIDGHRGKTLGLHIAKPGYVLATRDTSFIFSKLWPRGQQHVADPDHPVIFRMWQLQGAEPLLSIRQRYKLAAGGAAANIDLLTGKIVPSGGDLRIAVSRSPGVLSAENPGDWGVQIEAVDGGIMDAGEQGPVTYWAPESGYQPRLSFSSSTNTPHHWSLNLASDVFLISRSGQVHSSFGMTVMINRRPEGLLNVELYGVANTNGSGNWEAMARE